MKTETIHYLTQAELQRLLKAIESKRDKAIFYTAYIYGLRASEVGLLHISDVDFDRKRIRITRKKGSVSGELMLKPEVAKAIKSYLRTRADQDPTLFLSSHGSPISRRTLDYSMKKYGAKAEIPLKKQHFHTLKHSIATHLLEATNNDVMFVQSWLGHKRIQNTLVYAQLLGTTKDEVARNAFASTKVV